MRCAQPRATGHIGGHLICDVRAFQSRPHCVPLCAVFATQSDSLEQLKVIVTARDANLGTEALKQLRTEEGVHAENLDFHQLDITDQTSIDNFAKYVQQKYNGAW